MNQIEFYKYTGAGNNYIYIDAREINTDWVQLAKNISDPNFGIGSDGLIILDKSKDSADFSMRMFNRDGSEGEMCGNGMRCLARFAKDLNVVPNSKDKITISTKAGHIHVKPQYSNNIMNSATVDMGRPIFETDNIPVISDEFESSIPFVFFEHNNLKLKLYSVNTGVPHCVAFIDTPVYDFDLEYIGPLVEKHKNFPNKVNFEIVNIINENTYDVRVWERGSGITLACGTGAAAVAAISHKLNMHNNNLDMNFPGGKLTCNWDGENSIFMEGPIEFIGNGIYKIQN